VTFHASQKLKLRVEEHYAQQPLQAQA
jgi:integration host factor subunit alpha